MGRSYKSHANGISTALIKMISMLRQIIFDQLFLCIVKVDASSLAGAYCGGKITSTLSCLFCKLSVLCLIMPHIEKIEKKTLNTPSIILKIETIQNKCFFEQTCEMLILLKQITPSVKLSARQNTICSANWLIVIVMNMARIWISVYSRKQDSQIVSFLAWLTAGVII